MSTRPQTSTTPTTTAPSGSTTGSGTAASQQRDVADFSRVDLAGVSKVVVTAGKPKSVVVRGDANLLRLITTEVSGGTLVVSQKGSFNAKRGIEVDVSTPSLTGVTLSGTGDLAVTGIRADRFRVDLSGAGRVTAAGTSGRLDAAVIGVGVAQLERLLSQDTHVVVSGTGTAAVYAGRSLDASVSGAGSITYTGNPQQVKSRVSGAGSVHRG